MTTEPPPAPAVTPPAIASDTPPWYQKGLHFSCTQCGHCCGGAPGYVWISTTEIDALASHLQLDSATFRARYTVKVQGRGVSLKERGRRENYHCVFFEPGAGCSIYAYRPAQCKTWPFWRSVLASERTWLKHAAGCPGMNNGRWHDATLIASTARTDGVS